MKIFEVVEQTNEGLLRNLVGDVRNAFKPGIAVTPNMISELEDGLARLQRGEQPSPRQQKMMNTFMSTTLAREVKKTFGVDIDEGIFDLFSRGSQASGLSNISNMAGKNQANMQDVARKAKQHLDNGMRPQQIVQALQQEFGVNQQSATQAVRMVQAGIVETTSAGAVASVAAPVGGMIARQPRNSDGTAKNALDQNNNLMGGTKKKKRKGSSSN